MGTGIRFGTIFQVIVRHSTFFFSKSRVINSVLHTWFNPWALVLALPLLNGTIFQVTIRQRPPLTLMLGTATRYVPHPEYPSDHFHHLESKAFTSSVCELENITVHSFYNLALPCPSCTAICQLLKFRQ